MQLNKKKKKIREGERGEEINTPFHIADNLFFKQLWIVRNYIIIMNMNMNREINIEMNRMKILLKIGNGNIIRKT